MRCFPTKQAEVRLWSPIHLQHLLFRDKLGVLPWALVDLILQADEGSLVVAFVPAAAMSWKMLETTDCDDSDGPVYPCSECGLILVAECVAR